MMSHMITNGRDTRHRGLSARLAAATSILAVAAACFAAPGNETKRTSTHQESAGATRSSGGDWMNFEKPSDEELKKRLTPLQYKVTQREGTEPPFQNEYWNNHAQGIYVDVVSGEPLFSSLDKYESGTGWPSFIRPLEPDNIKTKTDFKLIYPRTEVRSKLADSHLGHVFNDGPAPTGLRYCMNSASMRFIPVDKLEEAGYGQYQSLFEHVEKIHE